jgi:hypothetical protein
MGLRLQDIERLHLGLLLALLSASLLSGWLSPASLLLGGAVMGVNFWLMRHLASRLLTPGGRRPAVVLTLMLGKFTLFIGLLGLLFWRVTLDPLAFAVGVTLLPVACVVAALRAPSAVAQH